MESERQVITQQDQHQENKKPCQTQVDEKVTAQLGPEQAAGFEVTYHHICSKKNNHSVMCPSLVLRGLFTKL